MLRSFAIVVATLTALGVHARQITGAAVSDVVLMSTVDTSNNHLVNIMKPVESENNATVQKVGSTSTMGPMDYIEQMKNVASSTTFDSQGGMVSNGKNIVAVANTYNDSISLMTLDDNLSLITRDVVNSEGDRPCSVALWNDIVCALNCGGEVSANSSIQCFNMTSDFQLDPISEMRATVVRTPFGAPHPYGESPSEIQFGPDGKTLIVASKDNGFQTFKVMPDKSLRPVSYVDLLRGEVRGAIKCFSQVGNGYIVGVAVTGPADDQLPTALATYKLNAETGEIDEKAVSVSLSQYNNACWSDYRNGFLYVITPTLAGSFVESFKVKDDGSLELVSTLDLTPIRIGEGRLALDAKLSVDGKFLYVSEQYVSNNLAWQYSIRAQPPQPIDERVTPLGYSYVNTIAVSDGGIITLESIDSGRYPLAVTGLTTLSP